MDPWLTTTGKTAKLLMETQGRTVCRPICMTAVFLWAPWQNRQTGSQKQNDGAKIIRLALPDLIHPNATNHNKLNRVSVASHDMGSHGPERYSKYLHQNIC